MSIHQRYIPRNPFEGEGKPLSISVLRTSDNAAYLAAPIPDFRIKDPNLPIPGPQDPGSAFSSDDSDSDDEDERPTSNLASVLLPTAGTSISLILNHPNIISLVDVVQSSQLPGSTSKSTPYADITIWEDMTAGSLSYLLPSPDSFPPVTEAERWKVLAAADTQRFSLPESLCWHVLRSISRALLWLHHGVKETAGIPGEWEQHDDDWHPIMIRDVCPDQIWFKKPDRTKGELYGACKLGGFRRAKVCGSVGGRFAMADPPEDAPAWKKVFWAPEIHNKTQLWTRAAEIWSLGAVLYVMMTGIPPPALYSHDWQVSRMNDKSFSPSIRQIVGDMLKIQPAERPTVLQLVARVEDAWGDWKAGTENGKKFEEASDVTAGESMVLD